MEYVLSHATSAFSHKLVICLLATFAARMYSSGICILFYLITPPSSSLFPLLACSGLWNKNGQLTQLSFFWTRYASYDGREARFCRCLRLRLTKGEASCHFPPAYFLILHILLSLSFSFSLPLSPSLPPCLVLLPLSLYLLPALIAFSSHKHLHLYAKTPGAISGSVDRLLLKIAMRAF